MTSLSVAQCLAIGIWVALADSRILGYQSLLFRYCPLMTGLVVGIIMGNIPGAMKIAAAIQLIYMGTIAPGGSSPTEPAVATAIAVPIALLGNLPAANAIAIAVPVGILGSYLYQSRFFLNTITLPKLMDKYADEANEKGLNFAIMVLPFIITCVLFIPVMFITLRFGAPVIANFANKFSTGIVGHVLTIVGKGLPALGIAVIVQVIGKKSLFPFFFLGYFMSVALAATKTVNTVTYAIFGIIFAGMYVLFTQKNAEPKYKEVGGDDNE